MLRRRRRPVVIRGLALIATGTALGLALGLVGLIAIVVAW